MDELIEVMVQPILDYIREGKVVELSPTVDQNLITGLLRTWDCHLKFFNDDAWMKDKDKKVLSSIVDSSFVYSVIWSCCVSCDTDSRRKMHDHFKKVCEGQYDNIKKFSRKVLNPCFDRGTIYDYVFFTETNEWKNWQDLSDPS